MIVYKPSSLIKVYAEVSCRLCMRGLGKEVLIVIESVRGCDFIGCFLVFGGVGC